MIEAQITHKDNHGEMRGSVVFRVCVVVVVDCVPTHPLYAHLLPLNQCGLILID